MESTTFCLPVTCTSLELKKTMPVLVILAEFVTHWQIMKKTAHHFIWQLIVSIILFSKQNGMFHLFYFQIKMECFIYVQLGYHIISTYSAPQLSISQFKVVDTKHIAWIWIWMENDQALLLMVILVHTWLVEHDTTISGHFLWAEMEIILFIHFYPPK